MCLYTLWMRSVQANHEHSPNFAQECLSDMFTWWLNNGHDVTYERLECGLRDIGETRMAKQFHQLHSNSSGEQMCIFNNTCREAIYIWFALFYLKETVVRNCLHTSTTCDQTSNSIITINKMYTRIASYPGPFKI